MNYKETEKKVLAFIGESVEKAGAKGCVIGLSGGLDSAVVSALCIKLYPETTLGLMMPAVEQDNELDSIRLAKTHARQWKIPTKKVNLTYAMLNLRMALMAVGEENDKIYVANLPARLRMASLYYHANKMNALVVGTGNKSECLVGYYTKYGDGGCDILPIADIYKSELFGFAEYLGIDKEIIKRKPSADLWPGQTDEGEIGLSYSKLDAILKSVTGEKEDLPSGVEITQEERKKVQAMIKRSEHKRNMPPACKL